MGRLRQMFHSALKFTVYKLLFPTAYHLGAVRKVRQKAVFVELHGPSNNFGLLQDAIIQKGGYAVQEICLDYQKDSFSFYWRCVQMLWEVSNASHIFLNDSCRALGAFRMRKSSTMVQTWHACGAFKKWGFSVAGKEYGEGCREMERYPYHRNYSLVTVSSQEVCWAYQEAFGAPSSVVRPLGVSRTDIYFRRSFCRDAKKAYEKEFPDAYGKKCILYAPTFRGTGGHAGSPGMVDYSYLQKGLGEGYFFIEKRHPFVKEALSVPKHLEGFVSESRGLTVEELLCVADICVTDYSSVVFEYALMGKPMLFFAYDLEEYYDNRGFYYDYKEFAPGPIVQDTKGLQAAIEEAGRNPQKFQEQVAAFRLTFMSACDGHATERILQKAQIL